ncbi:hypothetical protein DPMN_143847 [Dreissena polymorpha]|uniref:Uncharacterized protein n=1 Tax=Dreissena polymorpha TaxID=45954 RepID=A0A9D4GHT4_DREPO|nr:hypothetical protein DPMN_143847 [Dreissena polymorpha]
MALPEGAPGLVMGPCIVEIYHIVIREVQYQFEVNQSNFGWLWSMWAGRPRVGNGAMHKVQYQFERGRPRVGIGPCIVEIDRIVIREVQYQLEVNRCRNEEIIVQGNFWGAPGLVMGPCIFQGSSAYSVGGDSGQDGRKTGITTISPHFLRKAWG